MGHWDKTTPTAKQDFLLQSLFPEWLFFFRRKLYHKKGRLTQVNKREKMWLRVTEQNVTLIAVPTIYLHNSNFFQHWLFEKFEIQFKVSIFSKRFLLNETLTSQLYSPYPIQRQFFSQ